MKSHLKFRFWYNLMQKCIISLIIQHVDKYYLLEEFFFFN